MDMIITKVGRHGQITLPKQIRRKINLHEGDRIAIFVEGDVIILRLMTQTLFDLRGSVPVSEAQDFAAVRQRVISDAARRIASQSE